MGDKSNGSVANTNKRLDEAKFLARQIDLMRCKKRARGTVKGTK